MAIKIIKSVTSELLQLMNGTREIEVPLSIGEFPDKTPVIKLDDDYSISGQYILIWNYENMSEFISVAMLKKHLDSKNVEATLFMPYIPNARYDRVNNDDEVFTLKYFAEMLNDLNFKTVYVLDAHSPVSLALINNVQSLDVSEAIQNAVSIVEYQVSEDVVMFMPDEGAHKRYSGMVERPSTFGIKHRDWRSGDILGYEVVAPETVKDKVVVIIDDITSKGGTFLHAGNALIAAGAKEVHLYVTHCEETVKDGSLFDDDSPIKTIMTPNTLFDLSVAEAPLNRIVELSLIAISNA